MKPVPVVILSLLLLSYSLPSHACCVGRECGFLQKGGEIPANSKGLVFYCPNFEFHKKIVKDRSNHDLTFEIVHIEKGREQRLNSELVKISKELFFLRSKDGLTAGESYRFKGSIARPVEVTVGKQKVWPMKKRARLKIGPLVTGDWSSASVATGSKRTYAGKRTIELVLPPVASKYKQTLLFETTVDGKPWRPKPGLCSTIVPGRSWKELGTDLLFTFCGEKPSMKSLKPGRHRVRMLATMPGVGVIADSGNVKVLLKCVVK